MIHLKRYKWIYINVPKTGSESMRKFILENRLLQPEDQFSKYNTPLGIKTQNIPSEHQNHSHMDVNYIRKHGISNLVDKRIVGVIRDPIERLLSLYFYRIRGRRYENPGIADFRQRAASGIIKDYKNQMQLQHTFLELDGVNIGEWWCYDFLEKHIQHDLIEYYGMKELLPIPHENRSVEEGRTKDFIDQFYDEDTRHAVETYWKKDIDLYERTYDAYRSRGY